MVNDDLYTAISGCRICRSINLRAVIDLGEQALTGHFPAADEPSPPRAPLSVVRCLDCGLVQLKHSVSMDLMFGENYGYRSGINSTMRNHLSGIAKAAEELVKLVRGDVVLDIGCNDGTLLNAYSPKDIRRIGLDPIASLFREMYPATLDVDASIFSGEAFRRMSPLVKAKVITSISMFYDLEDPASFVRDIAAVLKADGVWILEQSYLPTMLEQVSFDTICHEHLEYYALKQIKYLVDRADLRILDVHFNEINGGSFQIWVCHLGASYPSDDKKIAKILEREELLGRDEEEAFGLFRKRVESVRGTLRDLLADEARAGKKIFVYGASTKGNVLLQYLGLDTSTIIACADRNPTKWGKRTPGTNIPIISEDDARREADYFLVLPWHFREEFLVRERQFLKRGGRFIFPLPTVEVVGNE
jgi:NDP-4-keto-2,6-dideoxyhexose 3-C-methyltransferase